MWAVQGNVVLCERQTITDLVSNNFYAEKYQYGNDMNLQYASQLLEENTNGKFC